MSRSGWAFGSGPPGWGSAPGGSRNFGGRFDLEGKEARLREIAELEAREGFWSDMGSASAVQREKASLKRLVGSWDALREALDEFEVLAECAESDDDGDSAREAVDAFDRFLREFGAAETRTLLSDEMDASNAMVHINAGAGGTESCDWAAMLLRMVAKWAESKGFDVVLFDERPGESAGVKSCALKVEGEYAYGLLKATTGVHRLVRISPFDSGARRHTSFSSVFVSPEVDDDIEIDVKDGDLKIDVYRSSGPGGQGVNTTDSAVRITHVPTGTVVTCQNERSQLKNKSQAMKILRSRLYEREMEKKRAKEREIESGKKDIEWGGQIISYVLHPYKLVKDHRTGAESPQAERVLDGDLDRIIDAFLRWSVRA